MNEIERLKYVVEEVARMVRVLEHRNAKLLKESFFEMSFNEIVLAMGKRFPEYLIIRQEESGVKCEIPDPDKYVVVYLGST